MEDLHIMTHSLSISTMKYESWKHKETQQGQHHSERKQIRIYTGTDQKMNPSLSSPHSRNISRESMTPAFSSLDRSHSGAKRRESKSSWGFPLSTRDDYLHLREGLFFGPERGIMSSILTLNYSNSGCSCCLRNTLRIKHKDQAWIRRKPLNKHTVLSPAAAPHSYCTPKSHTKLSPRLWRCNTKCLTPPAHLGFKAHIDWKTEKVSKYKRISLWVGL